MCKFVHEKQLGVSTKGRIEIQLLKLKASVPEEQGRQDLQSLEKHLGLRSPMWLHVPRHHVHPGCRKMLCRLEHGVGLAHAGDVAEEDLQRAPVRSRLGLLDLLQELVGIGATVRMGTVIIHAWPPLRSPVEGQGVERHIEF
jgi:hypothetical protein